MRRLWPALLVLAAGCATTADRPDYASVPRWTTRATPEARGDRDPGEAGGAAGSSGPDLPPLADRKLPEAYLYQHLWHRRVRFPQTVMPPWGVQGVFTPQELIDLVAYLQTLHGPAAPEKDRERNPFTRSKPVGFGDNLDATNNPAVVRAEDAESAWARKGPAGKACA